jgi:hypothetical protein
MAKKSILIILLLISGFDLFSQDKDLPIKSPYYPLDTFPVIYEMMNLVDTSNVLNYIQHLQDYDTRNATEPEAVQAQNWIKGCFFLMNYDIEVQDFPMGGYSASDNVIATMTGKVYQDEYVVLGAHYDSYAWPYTQEPGADDNASGTAGVLEIANILKDYEFERSIVFCAFSGEEYGLYGSEAFAARAQSDQINILGYINMDMIGYNHPGDTIHTDIAAPYSAQELVDFYTDVSTIYLPEFHIYDATGGHASDHVSFNNHGFMGIFPFEDDVNYSPYIHTSNDLIGPSVNSLLKAEKFIKAALSTIVSLAIPYNPVGHQEKTGITFDFRLFPNPAKDRVFIDYKNKGTVDLAILSITGQKIMRQSISTSETIDISGLQAGSYIINITGQDFTSTKKLIVM